jgi:hypothetical protein
LGLFFLFLVRHEWGAHPNKKQGGLTAPLYATHTAGLRPLLDDGPGVEAG